MKLKLFILGGFLSIFIATVPDVYLWQMHDEQGDSCCLHYHNIDICSPYKPCTRFLHTDLNEIAEYINRILFTEKGSSDIHIIMLKQIQIYIRNSLSQSFLNLSYRLNLKKIAPFYHEMLAQLKSSTKQLDKKAQLKRDYVHEYLVKQGLIRIVHDKNKR